MSEWFNLAVTIVSSILVAGFTYGAMSQRVKQLEADLGDATEELKGVIKAQANDYLNLRELINECKREQTEELKNYITYRQFETVILSFRSDLSELKQDVKQLISARHTVL